MPEYSRFETDISVRPDDIDMNRHVHNSKYLDYVLAARFDQMTRCYKMSMEDFLNQNLSWFVKEAYIEHKRQLKMGDEITVRTGISELQKRGVKVEFEIFKKGGKLSACGWFNYLMVYADSGRPAVLTDEIIEKYSV